MRIGALLALLFLSLAPVLAVDVDKCMEITQPGYYRLVKDISGILSVSKDYCIGIFANDVVLDGQGFSITGTGSGKGIFVQANNVTIKNVSVSRYSYGIRLDYSSDNNTIANNSISNNSGGIYLYYSSNNTIGNNSFTNCGLFVYDSYNNRVENNYVNGKPLVYLENASNQIISNAGQVILVNSNNITIRDLVISNASVGIELWNSSGIRIINNTISNNDRGIYLGFSSNNIVANNNISNNGGGIVLVYSNSNLIYNNLFNNTQNFYIYNSQNTWNTTLQQGRNILGGNWLGGNAWLKPDGTGYSQTCKDTEEPIGICDEPYRINSYSIDYLPLSVQMPTPSPPTDISQCMDITQSGYYKLNKSISGLLSGKDYCIKISANNVVLDGQGFSITGTGSGKGIFVQANNVTIKNVSVSRYSYGIYLESSSNNIIENNTLWNNGWGIYLYFSKNNTIANNTISNNKFGIHLSSSSDNIVKNNSFTNCGLLVAHSYNNRVENNLVNGKPLVYLENTSNQIISNAGQVILVNSNNITIRDLVISNASVGIELWNSSNVSIRDCTISGNYYFGIYLYNSSNNVIENSVISKNTDGGSIYLWDSSNNSIENCTISNNYYGIYLWNSSNNVIKNCTIYDNYEDGISLKSSSYGNAIENCTISNNYYGIYLRASSNNVIKNCNIFDNSNDGIYLESSLSNVIKDNKISDNDDGIYLRYSSNNILENITVSGNKYGIYFYYSDNNIIKNCTIFGNNYDGIYLKASDDNLIENNIISGNKGNGIQLQAFNNHIKNCTISDNNEDGIYLYYSTNNVIENNTISGNYFGISLFFFSNNNVIKNNNFTNCGLVVSYYSYNKVENNFVNGKPLVYLENAFDKTINDAGQVILVNSNNITIRDLVISNASVGIELLSSSNVSIRNSTITHNKHGAIFLGFSGNNLIENNTLSKNGYSIYFSSSSNNRIENNKISDSYYGIYLEDSSNNLIYNNLFNNTRNFYIYDSQNTWNTTLQQGTNILGGNWLGGNAWLSPDGKGFSQTCKDTEEPIGICDEPYRIDSNNIDYLPLSTRTPSPPTDISQCTEITKSGYYRLVNSISGLLSGKDYCIKISANNVVLDGQGFSITGTGSGKGIFVQADSVTIKNVSVSGYYDGIFLSLSSNNTIENCTLSGNYEEGIHLYSSNNNVIRSNKVSGNVRGIYLHSSSNNLMENNMISNNNDYGIHLSSSSDNIVKNNDFTNCGLVVYDSYNNRVENNYVNGKPLVYLENASNRIISNAGQVILVNSNNITVRDLVISNATIGIELWNSSNVSIRDCTISGNYFGIYLGSSGNNVIKSCIISGNNHFGIYLNSSGNNLIENNMILGNKHFIYLWSSNGNVIRNNEISYNDYGIYLHSSSNNLIYNNLFNNTKNVEIYKSANTWNTTLQQGTNILGGNLLGGNAWLKPDGTGYSQTCIDKKEPIGICDESYQLAENNIDYLPLSVQMPTPTPSEFRLLVSYDNIAKVNDEVKISARSFYGNENVEALMNLTINDRLVLSKTGKTIEYSFKPEKTGNYNFVVEAYYSGRIANFRGTITVIPEEQNITMVLLLAERMKVIANEEIDEILMSGVDFTYKVAKSYPISEIADSIIEALGAFLNICQSIGLLSDIPEIYAELIKIFKETIEQVMGAEIEEALSAGFESLDKYIVFRISTIYEWIFGLKDQRERISENSTTLMNYLQNSQQKILKFGVDNVSYLLIVYSEPLKWVYEKEQIYQAKICIPYTPICWTIGHSMKDIHYFADTFYEYSGLLETALLVIIVILTIAAFVIVAWGTMATAGSIIPVIAGALSTIFTWIAKIKTAKSIILAILIILIVCSIPLASNAVVEKHGNSVQGVIEAIEGRTGKASISVYDTHVLRPMKIKTDSHALVITPDGKIVRLIRGEEIYVPTAIGEHKVFVSSHSGGLFSKVYTTSFNSTKPNILMQVFREVSENAVRIDVNVLNADSYDFENLTLLISVENSTMGIVFLKLETFNSKANENLSFSYSMELPEDVYKVSVSLLMMLLPIHEERFILRIGEPNAVKALIKKRRTKGSLLAKREREFQGLSRNLSRRYNC
ncbi:MAG: NosD domain-containing protein [Archaeoglobaceae archaeon]